MLRAISSTSVLLSTAVVLALAVSFASASITVDVESETKACFATYAEVQSVVSGNYDLLDDSLGSDAFKAIFYGPDGSTIWSSEYEATEGSFTATGSGRYELCFENGTNKNDDDDDDRAVGFAIRVFPLNAHDPNDK
mmetsp:Transcript_35050/g.81073  ORF Transcript_35050/g.81073 Transcript_35050/m.81073 type:complete len:137 (+) Transcript_35050:253-663(+)